MRFLNKFSFLLFAVALVFTSCSKEEVISEDDTREQALEQLVTDLENISDQDTDELEKGSCGSHGYGTVRARKWQSGGKTFFNYKMTSGGNKSTKWYYWHVDMKNPNFEGLKNYRLAGGSGMPPVASGASIDLDHTINFPGVNQWSSRAYLYVWTGSYWCRLDVDYI